MKVIKTIHKKIALALFLLSSLGAGAQITLPAPSPMSTVTQMVGLTEISVNYSRPSAKGRKVMGDLVPYGEMWRTGANMSTKLTFKDSVSIQGMKVPAGEYSLFTIPGAEEWTIIINKNPKLAGTSGYKKEEDVARFTVKSQKSAGFTETFTINFADLTSNSAVLELSWENTVVPIKLVTEVETKVMNMIKRETDPKKDANTFYQAARYYYETDKDPKKALEWITKSVDLDPKFWTVHLKAKIMAANNDKKGAIAAAQKSIEMAKEADNKEYVKMNEELIAEWSKKK